MKQIIIIAGLLFISIHFSNRSVRGDGMELEGLGAKAISMGLSLIHI